MGRESLQAEHTQQYLSQSAVNISGVITFSPICHLHEMNKCVTSIILQRLLSTHRSLEILWKYNFVPKN